MNSVYVVQLEAKPGLLAAVVEEDRQEGGRDSRRIEIALHTASPKQRAQWRRLAGYSALGLHRLIEEQASLTVSWPARTGGAAAENRPDGPESAEHSGSPRADHAEGTTAAAAASKPASLSVRTELAFDGGEAEWELAADPLPNEPAAWTVLQAAAEAVRVNLAFGLTLAGVDPGELAGEALEGWSADWEAESDEAAEGKAAPRAAAEGGGREIADWIASAAEKGLLHEHGRLPEEPPAASAGGEFRLPPCDFSLLPDSAPAELALAELRRAMRARYGS
ncbi:hypothetical protein [Saccharibacillus qingshengii]|uniref:hypothetical protein n=1 Tax=Saccharibacillus qingshengii TaxID=1763540 RepID=UPI00155631FC|nr:hypothetical protein [Saccharibacillus qingshengii]